MKNTQKRKISSLVLLRRAIQILAFVLIPGLFISTFAAMKTIYTAIIGGTFTLAGYAGQWILVVAMLLIAAIMGRFFCGFLCSFGSIGDFFWFLGKKLKLRRPTISQKTDRILKSVKFVLLGGIILLGWTLGASLLSGTANPWTVFGMYATWKGWTDLSGLVSIGALLLLVILVGSMLIERFFCRYLCPLGAVFSIVSRFRLFKLRKPAQNCGSCQACTKRCSMGIPLYGMNVVADGECIDCMNCVDVCPRDNVKANPKPALAAAVAVAAIGGMYFAGNLASSSAATQSTAYAVTLSATQSSALGQYVDGVYTGSGSGYHGSTQVQVTVSGGFITDITVLSTGDDAEFFSRAKSGVISEILSSQSTSVDTVSGATFSSNGIIDAVKDALSGALDASSTVETGTGEENASSVTVAEQGTTSGSETAELTSSDGEKSSGGSFELEDGVYTGTGTGFRGETSVRVTIENGSIASIEVTAYNDDERYFSRAETTVISEILAAQTPDVDAVSGATFSSNGIMEAVANALDVEFTSTTPAQGGHEGQGRHGKA